MSSTLEKLTFTILLLDKISQPAQGVCKSIQKIQAVSKDAFQNIGKGWAGVTAGSILLHNFTGLARNFTKALDEVGSLGAPTEELDKLGKASKLFAMRFGGDAAAIARSAYDIQSAIPGLAKGALAAFTVQGNLLAKAGKATSKEVTDFFGTMYSVFETDAKRIGEGKWIEQLTGKMAYAVKMYKTTMPGMAAAFSNLGSAGKISGISLEEQTAVLGTLQGTMGGAVAGSSYKAFLGQVAKAQEVLGISFQDSQKKMLPIVDILEKIRKKVGPGELKLADQKALFNAFGQEGAKVVMNLLDKTEKLKGSINNLGKIQTSGNALEMAEKMTDPLDRFTGTLGVLKITLGQTLLPAVNAVMSAATRVMGCLEWLLENIPPLRWIFAAGALALSGVAAAMGTLYIVSGIAKLFKAFWLEIRMVTAWCLRNSAATHSMTFAQRLNAIGLMLWGKALQFCKVGILGNCKALLTMTVSMIGGLIPAVVSGSVAVWGFAAALWATGIPEIVLAIAALVAGVVLVYRNFDKLNSILPGLGDGLLMMLGPIGWIAELIKNWDNLPGIFTRMGQGIRTVYDWIAGKLCTAFRWVSDLLVGFWNGFKKMCPNIANLLEKLFVLWWEGAKGAFRFWRDTFTGIYQFTAGIVKAIGGFFTWLWQSITEPLSAVWTKLSGIGDFFAGIAGRIGGAFSSVFSAVSGVGGAVADTVTGIFSSVDGWIGGILRKVSKIPGLGFLNPDVTAGTGTQEIDKVIRTTEEPGKTAVPVVQNIIADHGTDSAFSDVIAARRRNDSDIPAGGVRSSSKVNHWGGVNIFAPNGMGPGQLEEWALLQG